MKDTILFLICLLVLPAILMGTIVHNYNQVSNGIQEYSKEVVSKNKQLYKK